VSQSFSGGVIKGQQTMEDENDAYVYECIEALNISISICREFRFICFSFSYSTFLPHTFSFT